MNFISALFFSLLLVVHITCLHAPDGNEEVSGILKQGKPESSASLNSVTNIEHAKNSDSSEEYSSIALQEDSSSASSSTSELEEVVTPTVAPATPSDDLEPSFTINTASSIVPYSQENNFVLSSVILVAPSNPGQIQSSEGAQNVKESSYLEAVATKEPEVLSSVLHSTPPVAINSKPAPTPPSNMMAKEDDDSITAALNQAEEESKPTEEEMPSFDEFKRRVLQEEEEKSKQQSTDNSNGTAHKLKPKKVKERKQSNYASVDCGAKILDHNDEASNADSILVENKDLYMLNPCSAKVWFVVELCDIAHVKSIQIANFELFSSTPESFRVYVSKRYPTREWTMLGTFQAREERTIQSFPLDEPIYAKYFKVEMLSHFGSEHYCPLSLLRVYGSSMMEELEDHEIEGQDDNENSESDSDVPVLPPEPGAKVDNEPKKPNLLERAADTVISLVKKITGNGQDKEKSGDDLGIAGSTLEKSSIALNIPDSSSEGDSRESESQAESKHKIVTLLGHQELEESPIDNKTNKSNDTSEDQDESNAYSQEQKSVSLNTSNEDSSVCKEVENDKQSETTSIALTPCQAFAQAIGPYCLGCFMGKLVCSKKLYQDFTFLVDGIRKTNTSNTTSSNSKGRKQMDKPGEKERDDEGEVNKQELQVTIQEKLSVSEILVENNTPSENESQESSLSVPEPTSSNLDVKSETTVFIPSNIAETEDTSPTVIKPSQSVDVFVEQKSGTSDDRTPSLVEVSVVTATPLNSTQSSSSSVTLQRSELPVFEESKVIAVKEESDIDNKQTAREPLVQQSLLSGSLSTVSDIETAASVNKDTSNKPVEPLESNSISEEREKSKDSTPGKIDESIEGKAGATPTEAKVPNSLHMLSNSSPDIDVLETKLTDKEGREGTAEVVEAPLPVLNGALQDNQVADSQSLNIASEDAEKVTSPNLESHESGPEGTTSTIAVEFQSVGPTVQPASVPISDSNDLSDSVLPLPAPPIASVSSQEFITAASDANLDAAMLSKAQQAAASSAGLSSVVGSGGHKESIFVRLSNKIKALEQNLNMSTLYMEQLNQRYRKSLDELQKGTDKKVSLLTNATKKAEVVINSQKEQIAKLQSRLDNLTSVIAEMKARMDPLNKEVMERHVIGLCIEIVLILMLFIVFTKRNNNHNVPGTPRGSGHCMNGNGPPKLAIEDVHKDDVFQPAVSLSGREQLLRSFGKTPEPDTVGASTDDNKLSKADPLNPSESKKKRNRKRKGSSTPDHEPPPDRPCSTNSPSPASFVSRTAGLLFSSARGLLSGFHNPWKPKKPSSVHSDPGLSVRTEETHMSDCSARLKQPAITRAKSLDSVPEETATKRLPPPPPPPPIPPEFGVVFKRPPDCYYSKKGSFRNITPGPMKYGKYGVLDSQLA